MPPSHRLPPQPRSLPPALGECVVGETLRTVRIWTEAEWLAMTPEQRPTKAEHCPGVGWLSAGPMRRPSSLKSTPT